MQHQMRMKPDVLRAALMPLHDKILCAFMYGSMASGETSAASDIDVMLVGKADFSAVVQALAPAQGTMAKGN